MAAVGFEPTLARSSSECLSRLGYAATNIPPFGGLPHEAPATRVRSVEPPRVERRPPAFQTGVQTGYTKAPNDWGGRIRTSVLSINNRAHSPSSATPQKI